MTDFVLTGRVDDRDIIESFKRLPTVAAEAGKAAGQQLDKSLSSAGAGSKLGDGILRSVQGAAGQFPNVISNQLSRATSAASTPATQLGTLISRGVQGGADKIPAAIAAALASASSRGAAAGTQLGTSVGNAARAPLNQLLGSSVSSALASAAGGAQRSGQQVGTSLAGGAKTSLQQLLPNALTSSFATAPAIGGRAGQQLSGSLRQGISSGLGSSNLFAPVAQQASTAATTISTSFSRSNAGVLAASAGLKSYVDEQGRVRTATGLVVPELDRLSGGFRGVNPPAQEAGKSFKDLVSTSSLLEGAVGGLSFALANALSNAAQTALGSVVGLVRGYADLDAELRKASAIAGESGAYERLDQVVTQVGIEAAATTLEVAQLATTLTRAGFTVDQVAEAMPGIVRGAEATGTAFDTMGSIVGNVLRGFALDTTETARVVDVLVTTANSSNTSVEGLGEAMKFAAPVAKALNIGLEDLAATTGLMANAGIDASVAGTGLRTGLERLQMAAAGASGESLGLSGEQLRLGKAMRVLGAEVTNTNGELRPLDDVLLSLKGRLSELSTAERVEISSVIFGQEAGSKFLGVLNQSEAAIRKMFETVRGSKGSTDVARDAMQSFQLSLAQLQGTADAVGNTLGKVIATALTPFIAAGNLVLGAIVALPGPVRTLTATLILLAAAYVAAKVAQATFAAAMKQEIVATAITEIRQLGAAIKGGLVADLGRGAAAFKTFVQSINIANIKAGAASLLQLATAAKANVAAGMLAGAQASGQLATRLADVARTSGAANASVGPLGGLLNTTVAGGAKASSAALGGVSKALAGLAAGTVTAGLAALAIGLTGVVAAAGSYALIMKKAGTETDLAREPINKLEAELKQLGVPIADTTALGGPFNRFLQDARGNFANFLQGLIPIPGTANAVKGALDLLGQALRLTPFGFAAEQVVKLAGGLRELYAEAQKNQAIVEAEVAMNKFASNAAEATNRAIALTAQIRALPNGAELDKGKIETLRETQEQLRVNIEAVTAYRANLLRQADAAAAAGNPEYAEELRKRAERLQVEIDLLTVSSDNLSKSAAARRMDAAAAREQKVSIDELLESLKKREQLNQVGLLEAEAAGLAAVADGSISAARATQQKNAAVVAALRSEIALIDEQSAKLSAADRISEKGLELRQQRAQKAVQLAQIEADATTKRTEAERELNRVLASAPLRSADAQIKATERQVQAASTLLNFGRALTELEQSRFSLQGAVLDAQLQEAQARGASERQLNQIKANQARLEAQAATARFNGLQRVQAIELAILALTQRKAALEAQQGVNTARVALLQRQQDLQQAINNGDEKGIILAREAVAIAQAELGFAGQNLDLLRQLQPLEQQIALFGQEKARNEAKSAAFTAQFKANLAGAVGPGGQLASNANRTKTSFNDLNADTQDLVRNLSGSNGILGELSRRMFDVKTDSGIAARSARQIGLFGVGSADSYGSIGGNLRIAGASAAAFARSGIDDATAIAAGQAGRLSTNMQTATRAAFDFYNILADASGLPGARWAGGPVEAGGRYRINDGPGGRSLGQEAFLSSGGRLSLINRAANSLWTAPSSGVVIPAGVTARLQEQGVLPGGKGGSGGPRRSPAAVAPGRSDRSVARLERAIVELTAEVQGLKNKDWNVVVPDTSGARQRQMLNMISRLT